MMQGLVLFADCVEKGDIASLSAIFRLIMIDCHVLLEKYFIHQIGSNPFIHDLDLLGQMSYISLSEEQKMFLDKARLMIYWARYPACSEAYFEKNQPLLLQILNDLTNLKFYPKINTELHFLFKHTLDLVIPKELLLKPFIERVESLTKQQLQKSPQNEVKDKRFRSLNHSIRAAINAHKKTENFDKIGAISHLKELTYYLSWLETASTLQKNHSDPSLQFWHERNRLEIDKLFKHLYAADCLLHDRGDPRKHRFSDIFEILEEIRTIEQSDKSLLRSFNTGIALHYHTQPSPVKNYRELATECIQRAHGFSSQTEKIPLWSRFDEALKFFELQLDFTLKSLKDLE